MKKRKKDVLRKKSESLEQVAEINPKERRPLTSISKQRCSRTETPATKTQHRERPRRERRTRRSRRTTQRKERQRIRRKMTWESRLSRDYMLNVQKRLKKYKQQLTSYFGYCADPRKPTWENKMDYIKQMTVQEYYSRPTNRACHDYCVDLHMPVGARSLLGLGLKYCVKKTHPTNNYKKSIERFKSDVRRIN